MDCTLLILVAGVACYCLEYLLAEAMLQRRGGD